MGCQLHAGEAVHGTIAECFGDFDLELDYSLEGAKRTCSATADDDGSVTSASAREHPLRRLDSTGRLQAARSLAASQRQQSQRSGLSTHFAHMSQNQIHLLERP